MLRLPRKMMFAVEAVLDIAFHGSIRPVQSSEITGRQGIPRRYLEQVLQQLVRAGVLAGVRGPRGGYRLARERRRISIGEIVRVLGALDQGRDDEPDSGSDLGRLVVQPLWQKMEEDCLTRLDTVTIDDLCRQAVDCGIVRPATEVVDFSI